MLQIKLTLNSIRASEANNPNNLLPLSDDEILGALSYLCKIQSSLSRDEIINLYERVGMITDCLVNYDIEHDDSLLQPPAARLDDTGDTNASSSASHSINPSLITLDKGARDYPMTTSFPTPDSDRFHSPAQSSTGVVLRQPPSSPFDGEVQGHCASSAFNEHKPPHVEIDRVIPTSHGAFGCDENDFDFAIREIDEMESSGHLPDARQVSCDRTNDPESSTCPPVGGRDDEGIERVDTDEDDPMTSQLKTQISLATFKSVLMRWEQQMSNKTHIPYTTRYDNHPLVPETYVGSPTLGPGASYSAPETSTLDTPTTLMPTKRRVEASDGAPGEIFFAGQTSNNCQSTQYLSKYQPTVEDAPDETEHNDAEDPFAKDDNFGDSDVEAVLEEARKFLGDTSADHESPSSGATNTMNTELGLNAPVLAFCPPDSDDRHALPNKEQTDIPRASSEEENREIHRKRRLSSIDESQSTLPSRNLRARLLNNVGQKTSGPPNLDKDRWKGRFSHHTLLSTLLPDQKDEIERKSNRALRSDLPEFLEKHTKLWKSTGFWFSPLLEPSKFPNMPAGRKGHVIWRYVEAMQAEDETHYLKARLADIMLYLEYVGEFNRQKKAGHPSQTAKTRATDIICGTGSLPKAKADKTRMSFHEHKLVGERWWWSGCYLGRGFILLCSEETGKKVLSFSDCPGCVNSADESTLACCSKFDELVDRLLTDGQFPKQISKKEVQQWIKEAKATSQESVPTIHWQAWSTNAVASQASIFLSACSSKRS
ncbi:hypothetical protein DTO006G1_9639 [Penicillium roqueforti]|nr:hypothetical protein DTO006G1_9639 [Penicillium roqueforti]KAI3129655.1 hypothetical protein CBS147325_9569 [Penicillium roqueforti]KAI3157745.1 hypothetical protein DTO046C5_7764 [Penicillium roqueforti]KAI3192077.1 hypothetical protein CBS147311_9437 [Penicillium roqueforti]KAI3248848.1 hypothetical protein DTO006G7_9765 [Penicillium roqueforti]